MVNMIYFFIKQYRRLLTATVLVLFVLWLSIAWYTYNPHDQSWMVYNTDDIPVTNAWGRLGAHVAALCIYFFGVTTVIIFCFLLFFAYLLYWRRSLIGELDRILAWPFLIISTATLVTRFQIGASYCYGGLLGNQFYIFLVRYGDAVSATMLVSALLLSSLVLIAHRQLTFGIQSIIRLVQFLHVHRWIFVRCYHGAYIMVRFLMFPVIYLYRLFSGTRIVHYSGSIMQFEDEHGTDDKALTQIAHDAIWQRWLTDAACKSEEELHAQQSKTRGDDMQTIINDRAAQCSINEFSTRLSASSKSCRYELPSAVHLMPIRSQQQTGKSEELYHKARLLEEKLAHFGIGGSVVATKRGPVVTIFEYQPDINARISKITALEDDLALALKALSIRIIAPIPGTSFIGFEVANQIRETVYLSEILASKTLKKSSFSLPLSLGNDTLGNHVVVDLAKMPHLLIAGSTGSGKSVALHAMLMTLLCTRTPDQLKLILIDPKRLEFASYADIAHLVFPVITQAKQAIAALKWVVAEMESRYECMKMAGARNIIDYQSLQRVHVDYEAMPYMVIIIDELADLMMVGGRDIEDLLTRITQMARAAGIHLIVATQRPSVDVITGVIKVNFPSRISCRVTSKTDSRTILDCNGAEKLLGRGDMLYLDAANSMITRVHGAFVSDEEIMAIVDHIHHQKPADYCSLDEQLFESAYELSATDDALYQEVIDFLHGVDEISISLIQRRFRIGYNRSARIIEVLEAQGFVAPADGGKMRKVIRQ